MRWCIWCVQHRAWHIIRAYPSLPPPTKLPTLWRKELCYYSLSHLFLTLLIWFLKSATYMALNKYILHLFNFLNLTINLAFLRVCLITPITLLYSKSHPFQSPLTVSIHKCCPVSSSLSTHLYTSTILLACKCFQTNISNLKKMKKKIKKRKKKKTPFYSTFESRIPVFFLP